MIQMAGENPPPTEPSGTRHGHAGGEGRLHRLWTWFRHEFRKMSTAAVFFFLCFTLLRLTQAAVLQKFEFHTIDPLRALIGALIMAKVLIIADALPFVARYDARPIAFAAAWKTWIYAVLAFAFEFVDAVLRNRRSGWTQASLKFAEELSSPVFWMLQAWLLVLLFLFAAVRDAARRLGRERFREHFWGRKS